MQIFYAGEVGIAYRGGSIYYGEMMNGTLPKQGVGEPGPREKAIRSVKDEDDDNNDDDG